LRKHSFNNSYYSSHRKTDNNPAIIDSPVLNEKIYFNFCEASIPLIEGCTDTDAYGYIIDNDTGICHALKSEDDKIDTTGSELKDENNTISGIALTFVGGQCAGE